MGLDGIGEKVGRIGEKGPGAYVRGRPGLSALRFIGTGVGCNREQRLVPPRLARANWTALYARVLAWLPSLRRHPIKL